MSETQAQERRGALRARVDLRTVERRGDTSYLHPVVYLSATGMLLYDASFTIDRLADDDDLDLEFGLPGVGRDVRVRGRIIRVEPIDDGEPGVGVEFLGLDARDAEAIDAYIRGVLDGQASALRKL